MDKCNCELHFRSVAARLPACYSVYRVEPVPDISVVVAAHDEEEALPRCLGSLAACEKPGVVEIIVVDNLSTDRTAEVAARLGARVVACATPGAVHAKTAGVSAARAPLVAVLDADSTCP